MPVKAIEAILLCVDSQSIDSFVCTQKKLAQEYGCVKRTTTRLFKNMIASGFLEVVWEQNYSAGKLRVFKIGEAYKSEIEAYLSNFTPGDIFAAECPPFTETFDLAPIFSVSGLSFIEETEALAETFEKNENLPVFTRLPKATIAEGPKSATQSGKKPNKVFIDTENTTRGEVMALSTALYGHSLGYLPKTKMAIKYDFNKRLALYLNKCGYQNDPKKAGTMGNDLVMDFIRADFTKQRLYEGLDTFFNSEGIKGSEAALKLIYPDREE